MAQVGSFGGRNTMKKMHLFFAFAFFLGIIEMLYFYPILTNRMAVHFNAFGMADGWGTKDHFFLTMETVFVLLVVLFGALPLLLQRMPVSLINMPNKDYWLAPERKDQTMDWLIDQLLFVGAMALLLMDGFLYLCFHANFSENPIMQPEWLWGMIIIFFSVNIVWILYLIRCFRRPTTNPPAV
jgi:uncharacterized membrane protein